MQGIQQEACLKHFRYQPHLDRKPESTLEVQQQKGVRVTGMVTDKDKNPLPGVTIVVANVANPSGAVTDVDGLFQITVPAKNSTLEFSYIGFKKKSVSLNGSKLLNVVLEEDASELEEVVITGYGSQKKASIIGSIETIQPQQLQFGTSRTLSNNLAGKLRGVIAIQRDRKSTRLNSSHTTVSRMPSSA